MVMVGARLLGSATCLFQARSAPDSMSFLLYCLERITYATPVTAIIGHPCQLPAGDALPYLALAQERRVRR